MATLVKSKKSTYGGPYVYYTISATTASRTSTAIKIEVTTKAWLPDDGSWLGTGNPITVGIKVGGDWYNYSIKSDTDSWLDSKTHSKSKIFTIPVSSTATSITITHVRAKNPTGPDYSGTLSATKVSKSLSFVAYNGPSSFTLSSTSIYLGNATTVKVTEKVSSNKHRVYATTKNSSGTATTTWVSSQTTSNSISCTFSAANFGWLFSKTSKTATTTVYLVTYTSGGTNLGKKSKSLKLTMTSAIGAPTGLAVAHSSTSHKKVVFKITPPSCKYGATISSYTCTSNIGTVSRSGTTVTVTMPDKPSTTSVKLTVKATDSRGFVSNTATATASYNTYSSYTLSPTTITLGGTTTATATKIVSSNTHRMYAATKNSSGTSTTVWISGDATTSSTVKGTFSAANFGWLFGKSATSVSTTVYLRTYNSAGTNLGSPSKTVTLKMPASVGAPTGLKITHSKTVKGTVTFTIIAPSFKYGATLSKYSVTSTLGTVKVSGTTVTVTIPQNATASSFTVKATATDTRGFVSNTATATVDYNGVSTISGASTVNINKSLTVTVSKWVAANTNSIVASSKNSSDTVTSIEMVPKSSASSFNLPFKEADFGWLIPTNAQSAISTLTLTSYNSTGTSLGTTTKNVTVVMPVSVGRPTGLKLKQIEQTDTYTKVQIIAPTTKYGATIDRYEYSIDFGDLSYDSENNVFTISYPEGTAVPMILKVAAIDSRGFSSITSQFTIFSGRPKIQCGQIYCRVVYFGRQKCKLVYAKGKRVI